MVIQTVTKPMKTLIFFFYPSSIVIRSGLFEVDPDSHFLCFSCFNFGICRMVGKDFLKAGVLAVVCTFVVLSTAVRQLSAEAVMKCGGEDGTLLLVK